MTKKLFPTAVVFPGQGSQHVGMLSAFANNEIVRSVFEEASRVLELDLWMIAQENPNNQLNQTELTQPILLTACVAMWTLKQHANQQDILPLVFAGHSLGEYTALVCAKALSFEDAVYLVSQRGKFMQEAVPHGKGSMAAIIGLSIEDVDEICRQCREDEILSSANMNAPGQIVIAGETNAVLRAIDKARMMGAKLTKQLDVSVPSHCALMKPAAEKMKALLDHTEMAMPNIPVIQNVDARFHDNIAGIKDALVRQLYNPVLWTQTVTHLLSQYAIEQILECGPGRVLTGLNKRIVSQVQKDNHTTLNIITGALEDEGR